MEPPVLQSHHDFQILNAIIFLVAINMMHDFIPTQLSAEMFFHDVPMKINSLTSKRNVTGGCIVPAFPTRVSLHPRRSLITLKPAKGSPAIGSIRVGETFAPFTYKLEDVARARIISRSA
jgi:hypothetical protein